MPSPFPGMDPYLEGEEWTDFHGRFNMALSAMLSRKLRPHYSVRAEKRVYLDEEGDTDRLGQRVPDNILYRDPAGPSAGVDLLTATATVSIPITAILPQPVKRRETYLIIRSLAEREVVTVIETLSPANKRRGSLGREVYLRKRAEVQGSLIHLVEIDLLRGGEPMPAGGDIPPHTYRAVVSRWEDRPRCQFHPWLLNAPLPTIAVPLKGEDESTAADLQTVFEQVFDDVAYDLELPYAEQPPVPFTPAEATYARTLPGVLANVPAEPAD